MKRWAIVILKVDNSLDWFSVYAENREEAEKNADATIADHFSGAEILDIIPYKKELNE